MNPIWIGSPIDIKTGDQALQQLQLINDTKYSNNGEITQVTQERWQQAQQYEHDTWMKHGHNFTQDRNQEHAQHYNNYKDLPQDLGNLLEIGCGPFTQTITILSNNHTAQTITLLDPLIQHYTNHPNCTYHKLTPKPTLLPIPAEQLPPTPQYNTIILINVLEHVQNATQVLQNTYNALTPNGILILADRNYTTDPTKIYDIGHPIKININTLTNYTKQYTNTIYHKQCQYYSPEINEHLGKNHYLILQK